MANARVIVAGFVLALLFGAGFVMAYVSLVFSGDERNKYLEQYKTARYEYYTAHGFDVPTDLENSASELGFIRAHSETGYTDAKLAIDALADDVPDYSGWYIGAFIGVMLWLWGGLFFCSDIYRRIVE